MVPFHFPYSCSAMLRAVATFSVTAGDSLLHRIPTLGYTSRPGPSALLLSKRKRASSTLPSPPAQAGSSTATVMDTDGTGGVGGAVGEDMPQGYNQRWHKYWEGGLKPGEAFDASGPSPALLNLLTRLDVGGKRAFVPGCGRGYDVVAFVGAGAAEAVGLELVEEAAAAASEYVQQTLPPELAPRAKVVNGDFFAWEDPQGGVDVGYDYTFLCALHPTMRADWGAAWGRLISPGGRLVTLIFPVDPERTSGPPWAVTPELYTQLLTPNGFEQESLEQVPPELSHPERQGKEYIGVWVRK